jgi:hypothetical protein
LIHVGAFQAVRVRHTLREIPVTLLALALSHIRVSELPTLFLSQAMGGIEISYSLPADETMVGERVFVNFPALIPVSDFRLARRKHSASGGIPSGQIP